MEKMLIALDEDGEVAALKDMTERPMAIVPTAGEPSIEALHSLREVRRRRFEEEW